MSDTRGPSRRQLNYCSFCGKSEREVLTLIPGPAAHICNECVALCATVCASRSDPGFRSFLIRPPS